jgi:hypothetical protein
MCSDTGILFIRYVITFSLCHRNVLFLFYQILQANLLPVQREFLEEFLFCIGSPDKDEFAVLF